MSPFASLKANLNAEQVAAATRLWAGDEIALQTIAGAGSGKTTTLIAATFAAIEAGHAAEQIAVITFSRRAAHELTERFEKHGLKPGYCGTMHALAWRLLKYNGIRAKILLHATQKRNEIARGLFSHYRHIPERVLLSGGFMNASETELLNARYDEYLSQNHLMDFDGMIAIATAHGFGAEKFSAILVDEFQDTSPDQIAFIRSLKAKKLFVVGDDWQSIYGFRGADVSLTRDFMSHFENSKRVYLKQNYRSGKPIVKLGNRLIRESKNFVKKKLSATLPAFHKPTLFFSSNATDVRSVWKEFRAYLSARAADKKLGFLSHEKTTVLVRTNSIRRVLEDDKPENFEILTIHKSKGLEFNNVIVFGIAEHILPHRDNDVDEEVRILYVALTRAKRFLGFVAWERPHGRGRSAFLPLLMRRCKLIYI